MSWLESLVLGLIQGFTEYLPISSSGHLAIMSSIFGIDGEQNLKFTVLVHIATVLSTLVILNREIMFIFRDLFKRQSWNSYKNLNEGESEKLSFTAIHVSEEGPSVHESDRWPYRNA